MVSRLWGRGSGTPPSIRLRIAIAIVMASTSLQGFSKVVTRHSAAWGGIVDAKERRKAVLDEKGRIAELEDDVLHLRRLMTCLAVICASNSAAIVLLAVKLL